MKLSIDEFQPQGDMVLVKKLEEENQTAAGIILTRDLNQYATKGEVVSVGEGERRRVGDVVVGPVVPNDVEAGDVVYFTVYSAKLDLNGWDGEKYALIANRDILAKEV